MHRNTYLLVLALAILAALVVGVNIGKRFSAPLAIPNPLPTEPLQPALVPYTNTYCGFSTSYPNTLTLTTGASGSAVLTDSTNPGSSILIACQKGITRPPLTADKIEVAIISGAANAKLYHDASPKDGTATDALIFTNPNSGLDVFISGLGPTFTQIISSIQLTR